MKFLWEKDCWDIIKSDSFSQATLRMQFKNFKINIDEQNIALVPIPNPLKVSLRINFHKIYKW